MEQGRSVSGVGQIVPILTGVVTVIICVLIIKLTMA